MLLEMNFTKDGEIYVKLDAKGSASYGDVWDDGCRGQVKEICICHDADVIYSIQTTYEQQGSNVISSRHGGSCGNFELVTFSEPLTWVSGHSGSYCLDPEIFADEEEDNYCPVIRSLKFGTDRATYGPFGHAAGEPFFFKLSTGIKGFHGRSASFLHAIGVYYKSMASRPIDEPQVSSNIISTFASTTIASPSPQQSITHSADPL